MDMLPEWKKIQTPGIDSMETVEIGGISQALYFRGEDVKNPVILFLHGGPGYPEMPFLYGFQYPLEEHFTVAHWDQRNAGKTFFLNDHEAVVETLSFERVLADAYEVTQYIRDKLQQHKIIVMGHSWGTVLGTALVQAYPQCFSAYVGVGQAVNTHDNERVGFEALLEAARAKGDVSDIQAIEALEPYPPLGAFGKDVIEKVWAVRMLQDKYGLATSGAGAEIISASPYYSQKEKEYFEVDIFKYHMPIFEFLFDKLDVRNFGTTFEIPVFIIMGERDYQTPHTLARDFFEEISAPYKAFFLVADAGHNTMHENKAEFNRILIEEIKPMIRES